MARATAAFADNVQDVYQIMIRLRRESVAVFTATAAPEFFARPVFAGPLTRRRWSIRDQIVVFVGVVPFRHTVGDGVPEGLLGLRAGQAVNCQTSEALLELLRCLSGHVSEQTIDFDLVIAQERQQVLDLCVLPLDNNNAVFNLCCRLCSAYERKSFLDGLQYGAELILELGKEAAR